MPDASTPYFTLDLCVADRAVLSLLRVAERAEVAVAYAVKVNPHPALLSLFHSRGLMAEVVSERELDLALDAGFQGKSIIVNGPYKPPALMARAARGGAAVHLESLRQVEAAIDVGLSFVGLRIRVRSEEPSRFGLDLADLPSVAARLSAAGIVVRGLHVHRSERPDGASMDDWRRRAETLREALAVMIDSGMAPEYLDWGGGVVNPAEEVPSAADYEGTATPVISFVRRHTTELAARHGLPWLRAIIEPGRFLTEHMGTLHTRCIDVTSLPEGPLYVLDAGVGLLSGYDSWLGTYYVAGGGTASVEAGFAGPSCMEEDLLPPRPVRGSPAVGAEVVLSRCGSYHLAGANSFFHEPPTVLVRATDGRV